MKNLILIALLFILSCGLKIKSGVVTEKWIRPARSESHMIMMGKVPMIQTDYYPEEYWIAFRGAKDGEVVFEKTNMDFSEWAAINPGDSIHFK